MDKEKNVNTTPDTAKAEAKAAKAEAKAAAKAAKAEAKAKTAEVAVKKAKAAPVVKELSPEKAAAKAAAEARAHAKAEAKAKIEAEKKQKSSPPIDASFRREGRECSILMKMRGCFSRKMRSLSRK